MTNETYQIKLAEFEGPFDLLLFFIERDELDIYNIPITKITNDFLIFIHSTEKLNIELSSEFILFVSTLMRIKAKMLLPRKEIDALGNEIDPRQELIDKILEMGKEHIIGLKKRGNLHKELIQIGEDAGEGTEIQAVTLFKLMKAFEKVAQRLHEKNNRPVHTVVQYTYTMEESRSYILDSCKEDKTLSFEKIFDICQDRIHAIFLFLSLLELIQLEYMSIVTGEGRNNFLIEWNEDRAEDVKIEFSLPEQLN